MSPRWVFLYQCLIFQSTHDDTTWCRGNNNVCPVCVETRVCAAFPHLVDHSSSFLALSFLAALCFSSSLSFSLLASSAQGQNTDKMVIIQKIMSWIVCTNIYHLEQNQLSSYSDIQQVAALSSCFYLQLSFKILRAHQVLVNSEYVHRRKLSFSHSKIFSILAFHLILLSRWEWKKKKKGFLRALLFDEPLFVQANRTRTIKANQITYVAVLHGSDVRPEATVCRGQHGLHAGLQLIERHCKMSKVVHLWREEREQRIVNVCVWVGLCEDVGSTFRVVHGVCDFIP